MSRKRQPGEVLTSLYAMMGDDPEAWAELEEARLASRVAQLIYDARTNAGLTQAELARLVGTAQSVIARLEDADYTGHSLSMLRRVAGALGLQVSIELKAPVRPGRKPRAKAA